MRLLVAYTQIESVAILTLVSSSLWRLNMLIALNESCPMITTVYLPNGSKEMSSPVDDGDLSQYGGFNRTAKQQFMTGSQETG